jgi:predicted small secreted protein
MLRTHAVPHLHNTVYLLVAVFSLAVAACQPAEGPAEHAGSEIDHAAKKIERQVDNAAHKAGAAIDRAAK